MSRPFRQRGDAIKSQVGTGLATAVGDAAPADREQRRAQAPPLAVFRDTGSDRRYIAGSICDMVIAYPVGDRPLTCFAQFITRGPALVLERREFVAKEFVCLRMPLAPLYRAD